jgi:hypothetical protein
MAIEAGKSGEGISNMPGVDKENVQQAVVIVVQERDASGHGLDQVFSGSRGVAENKINPFRRAHLELRTGTGGQRLGKQAERAEQRKHAGFGKSCNE